MKKNISVEEAIKVGKRKSALFFTFYFTGFILIIIATSIFKSTSFFIIGLIIQLLLSILISCRLTFKWKLWAFSHVRNVHELYSRAIQEQIINPSNPSFMNRLEFKSDEEKREWQKVLLKFEEEDVFTENKKIGSNVVFYYSKIKGFYKTICYLTFTGLLLLLPLYENKTNLFIILFILGGIYLTILKVYVLFNRKPQLTITRYGIQHRDKNVMEWKDIENEQLFCTPNKSELCFHYKEEPVIINFRDYATSKAVLKETLETFRIRNNRIHNEE